MPAAIIGGAIAGVGAIGSAVISSNAAHSAADSAAQAAEKNNALQEKLYGQNKETLSPYIDRGNAAGTTYNAFLGLGGDQGAANGAFNTFLNSGNYKFTLDQGLNALNKGYAANGLIQSGAAMKAINNYAQNQAMGAENNWLTSLGNQQGIGLSAANSLAGVSTNYGNAVSNNNNNAANAAGNAALASGNAWSNALGGIANSAALYGGLSSSYKPNVMMPDQHQPVMNTFNNGYSPMYGGLYGGRA